LKILPRQTLTGLISRNGGVTSSTIVALASSGTNHLRVPASVTDSYWRVFRRPSLQRFYRMACLLSTRWFHYCNAAGYS